MIPESSRGTKAGKASVSVEPSECPSTQSSEMTKIVTANLHSATVLFKFQSPFSFSYSFGLNFQFSLSFKSVCSVLVLVSVFITF